MKPVLKFTTLFCAWILLASCNEQPATDQLPTNQIERVQGDTVNSLGNSIMVIYQDKLDNYWFGSWETGVYKYDGKTLINYTTDNGLPNNRIDEIKEDEAGNIYFSSCHPTSSVCKFDGNSFSTLSPVVSDEWELNANDLWFKHAYGYERVYRFDGSTLFELTLPKPEGFTVPFEIYSIYKDQKGNIWFGSNPVGACRFNGTSFDWITEEDVTEFHNEGANGVRSVLEDKNGDFWFNSEYKYSVYDPTIENDSSFYSKHKSIGSLDGEQNGRLDEYLSSLIDNENNLWFVTYLDGIWKYNGTNITNYRIQDNFEDIGTFSIYKDNQGDLWVGTHNNGAYKFNGTEFIRFLH